MKKQIFIICAIITILFAILFNNCFEADKQRMEQEESQYQAKLNKWIISTKDLSENKLYHFRKRIIDNGLSESIVYFDDDEIHFKSQKDYDDAKYLYDEFLKLKFAEDQVFDDEIPDK